MPAVEIKPGIFWIGVNDHTTDLFEGLWPIVREGVSYNSYIINDDKKVLIDLAKASAADDFFGQITQIVDLASVDYVVVNHMEADHSGAIKMLQQAAPKVKFLCTPKASAMLDGFYGIKSSSIIEVNDGQTVELGRYNLKFFHVPFVHWPETMVSYETQTNILFSCDAFGSYGALSGSIFEDEYDNLDFYEKEALRYYVNIVAKFSSSVLKAIEKLGSIKIDIIAPSHGLLWRRNPLKIIELYRNWASYAAGKTQTGITLIYGSMYGNTEAMMNAAAQGIASEKVQLQIFDAGRIHISYILPAMWTQCAVLIGSPTYEGHLFPPVASVIDMSIAKGMKNKLTAIFGSYGWNGGAVADLKKRVEPAGWEIVDSLTCIGGRHNSELLKKVENFAAKFAKTVKQKNSMP